MNVLALAGAYLAGTALVTGWLWAVARWGTRGVPVTDFLVIAALCTALALLPGPGVLLAAIFMALLVIRVKDTDVVPALAMLVGSGLVWIVIDFFVLGWI